VRNSSPTLSAIRRDRAPADSNAAGSVIGMSIPRTIIAAAIRRSRRASPRVCHQALNAESTPPENATMPNAELGVLSRVSASTATLSNPNQALQIRWNSARLRRNLASTGAPRTDRSHPRSIARNSAGSTNGSARSLTVLASAPRISNQSSRLPCADDRISADRRTRSGAPAGVRTRSSNAPRDVIAGAYAACRRRSSTPVRTGSVETIADARRCNRRSPGVCARWAARFRRNRQSPSMDTSGRGRFRVPSV